MHDSGSTLFTKPSSSKSQGIISPVKGRLLVRFLREIAAEEGYEITTASGDWVISIKDPKGGHSQHIFGYKFDLNPQGISAICDDKVALSLVLGQNSLPHVPHRIFLTPRSREYVPDEGMMESLREFARKHGNDVVLKPNDGSGGQGVVRCKTVKALEAAAISFFGKDYSFAGAPFRSIQAEYRVVCLGKEAVLVYAKIRPTLQGDGTSSVRELLLAQFNAHPEMMDTIKLPDNFTTIDLDYIPKSGEVLPVIWKHNLGTGAQAQEVTDPALLSILKRLALQAVKTLHLEFVSVDIIELPLTDSPSSWKFPERGVEYEIIEINSGVMMEKIGPFLADGEARVKAIYKQALKLGFDLQKRKEAVLPATETATELSLG